MSVIRVLNNNYDIRLLKKTIVLFCNFTVKINITFSVLLDLAIFF